MYNEATEKAFANGGEVKSFFDYNSASARDKAIHDWIELMVMNSLPLSVVEDPLYRKFSKHDVEISSKTIKEVLFKLVELVEPKIAAELQAAGCGALMHDAWTKFSTHYMAFFACYMRKVKVKKHGDWVFEEQPECTLLSVAPMASFTSDGESTDDEAANFTAKTMKHHITNIAKDYYGIILAAWLICCISDNTAVNILLCKLLGVDFVGCGNHLLACDVRDTLANNAGLQVCCMFVVVLPFTPQLLLSTVSTESHHSSPFCCMSRVF